MFVNFVLCLKKGSIPQTHFYLNFVSLVFNAAAMITFEISAQTKFQDVLSRA
jgi:hypothetical protein